MLKKFILLFMMLISGLTFFVAFTSSERQAIHVAETAGTSIGRLFWIPPSALFSRPDSWSLIEPILDEASVRAHVNLIRTDMGYTKSNEAEITQYVLLTHRTKLFQSFQLRSGRFLGTTPGRVGFLSTQRTENPHQVGVLKEFGGSPIVTIRPLQQAFQSIPLPGQYTVEAPDRRDYTAFLHDFVNGVNARYSKDMARPYRIKDVQQPTTSGNFVMPADFGEFGGGIFSSITSSVRTVGLLVFLATLVLIVYFGFHEAKRIGIMKMHGWTNRRIWYSLIGRLIWRTFIGTMMGAVMLAFWVPDSTRQFVVTVAELLCIVYSVMTSSSLLLYAYARVIRVSDAVKGRQRTTGVLAVNTVLKVGWSVVLTLAILSLMTQFRQLQTQKTLLQNWTKTLQTQGYGVFYPLSVGRDFLGSAYGTGDLSRGYIEAGGLYPKLVNQGALYIDANDYTTGMLSLPQSPGYIPSVTVNPNYLRRFPVYDTRHRRVFVREDTKDWILLLPVQDAPNKAEILAYFHYQLDSMRSQSGFVNSMVPRRFLHQSIRVIWVANGQELFSFNPFVYPQHHNEIMSPIIQVTTLANTLPVDGVGFISGSPASSVKVRLVDASALKTYTALNPLLRHSRFGKSAGSCSIKWASI